MPRSLLDCDRDRFGVGEVEDDTPRRFPLPLLPLSPLSLPPRGDRLEVVEEVEDDLEWDRRRLVVSVGDPRPPLCPEALLDLCLERDLDLALRYLVLEIDGDLDLDRVVEPTATVWDWDCDRDRERCRDLDRFCCVSCRLVLLDGRRP